ncbi:MAG: MFS transporter, partial [Candidatus Bathyarchaeia archaeon]
MELTQLEPSGRYRWVVLSLAWVAGFFAYATPMSVPPMLEILREDLSLNYADVGVLLSLPILMLALLAVPGGMLADKYGIRKAGGVGIALIGVGGFLRGFSQDFTTLLLFSMVFGAGWGISLSNLPKLVGGWFPQKFVGTASGIYGVGILVGATLGLAISLPIMLPATGS